MLNARVGSPSLIDGRPWIETRIGTDGHAIYGDYLDYLPGRYAVEFLIAARAAPRFRRRRMCAEIDAVAGDHTTILAKRAIMLSELAATPRRFVLDFRLDAPARLQFRVGVNGAAALLIADDRPVARLSDGQASIAAALDQARFPDFAAPGAPAFLVAQAATLGELHHRGIAVTIEGGEVLLAAHGVRFRARTLDDLAFVGEIFLDNVYALGLADDACVIDIGMNCGLVALRMAALDAVKEVHGFEPFSGTLARARANIALNPALASKITTYGLGLSDRDERGTFVVPDMGCSGAMTIRQLGHGLPVDLDVRDAAPVLRPIFDAAIARGRRIVMKIDCEGSEFAIFASLAAAELLERVSVFMVEWHRVIDGKSQADLIAPLHRHGFVTIDRSPPSGNGFFYAVRASR